MIVIVDSGGANLVSIRAAFSRLGIEARVSADKDEILKAAAVILPGVGSAKTVMQRLQILDLVRVLQSLSQPILGICVGMQILYEYSEEGFVPCLGILKGCVKKLPVKAPLCRPHMGWNTLNYAKPSPMLRGISNGAYVYFVHSFMASLSEYTRAETAYGLAFSAAVSHQNVWGVQFHPERSGPVGQRLLKNFLEQSHDYIPCN